MWLAVVSDLQSPEGDTAGRGGLEDAVGWLWLAHPQVPPLSGSLNGPIWEEGQGDGTATWGLRPVSTCPLCSRTFSLALFGAPVRGGCFFTPLDE